MARASKDFRMEWHKQTDTSIIVPIMVIAKMLNALVFDPVSECWNYLPKRPGSRSTKGYPTLNWENKQHIIGLHRLALIFDTDAPAPPGLLALHSCGNRRCCAPYHLRWGNDRENAEDHKRHTAERALKARAGAAVRYCEELPRH
jgi:hypothetical protein